MQGVPPLPPVPRARNRIPSATRRVRKSTELSKTDISQDIELPSLNPANPQLNQMSFGTSRLSRRHSGVYPLSKLQFPSSPYLLREKTESLKPSKMEELEILEFEIQIHLISNWGDENEITVSEIDFLNSLKVPMKVLNVEPEADKMTELLVEYKKLSNGLLIKENENHKWKHEWSPEHCPITINFTVEGTRPPEYIRIWNTKETGSRNLRQIAVFYHEKLVARAEVPEKLGIVYPLKLEGLPVMPSLEELFMKCSLPTQNRVIDSYGQAPLDKFSTIVIRIFSPYEQQSKFVGLNALELITNDGSSITENEIESICIQDGNNVRSPFNLFKKDKYSLDSDEMWLAERSEDKSIDLIIQLKKAACIVLVRFWNYNYGSEAKLISASHIGLYMDSKQFSLRRIKPGNGTLKNINESVTDIWLTDVKQIRENKKIKTYQDLFPGM